MLLDAFRGIAYKCTEIGESGRGKSYNFVNQKVHHGFKYWQFPFQTNLYVN